MKKKGFVLIILIMVSINMYSQTREEYSRGDKSQHIKKSDSSIFPLNDKGKITFTDVIKTDSSLTANDLFEIINEWAISNTKELKRANSEKASALFDGLTGSTNSPLTAIDLLYFNDKNPIKLANKDKKKFIINVVYKYYDGGTFSQIGIMYVEYNLIIQIKNGRYKYNISNFRYTNYMNRGMYEGKEYQMQGFKNEGPCKSKGFLEETFDCNVNSLRVFYPNLYYDVQELIKNMTNYIENNNIKEDENW